MYLITRMPSIDQVSLERQVRGGDSFTIFGIVEDTPQNRDAVGLAREEIVEVVDETGRDKYIKLNKEAYEKIGKGF